VILHATLVARRQGGRWWGVLLRGASGSGKSDLALRALDAGWRLVADDRVRLWTSGEALYGRAPSTLAGLLEVRGVGVLPEPTLPFAAVRLCADAEDPPERLPPSERVEVEGIALPRLGLQFREASAPTKLGCALDAALRGRL
jgi:serine kinase of HPr protein (carbohydrate metabolism regulator)